VSEQPSTAVLMFVAHRAAEGRAMAALAEQGFGDITLAQSRLLQRLAPAGTRLTELAERARVTKQTARALVDQLERAGYVVRRADPADARARLVRLTRRGTTVCRIAARAVAQAEDDWRAHLGDEGFAAMRAALLSLREVTDPFG
jgi:DNA-binding MarR family transcriptional regulator